MTVDIQIDRLTDCLVERETGNVVGTSMWRELRQLPRKNVVVGSLSGVQHSKTDILFTNSL